MHFSSVKIPRLPASRRALACPRRIFVYIFHRQKGARLQQRRGAFISAHTRTSASAFIVLQRVLGRARRGSPRSGRVYIYGRKNILS